MQKENTKSWKLSIGEPQPLQFAAYIGSQEGFDSSESSQPFTQSETQWKEWWLALPEMEAERRAHFQELVKNPASVKPQKKSTIPFGFDAPDFSSILEDREAMRKLCVKYWPRFLLWYTQEREKFKAGEAMLPTKIGLHQLVNEIEQENKRVIKPFELKIDFVYWPENYLRFVSDNLIVVTSPDGIPERETTLKEILRSQIGKLA